MSGSHSRTDPLPPSRSGILFRLAQRLHVDRAVAYVLLARGWQFVAGPVTIVFIARYLTAETQGFYYTFASLIALQSFLELGLLLVVMNVASHEWARLGLDENGMITGHPAALSRLVSLGRYAFTWFGAASAVFITVVGFVGYQFLAARSQSGSEWVAPWLTLVAITGVVLLMSPLSALLEGCGQVAEVNRYRLIFSVIASAALWLTLVTGRGLWAAVVSVAAYACRDFYILFKYRRFVSPFMSAPSDSTIEWKGEVWPMQWRIAVQGLTNYFILSLFSPVMFRYYGAVPAGQIGLTWQLASAVQAGCMAWVQARAPQFGVLVAQREYAALDRLWARATSISLIAMAFVNAGVWSIIWAANAFHSHYASRFISPSAAALFLLATLFAGAISAMATYLRAYKRDPLNRPALFYGISCGVLVWYLGKTYGPPGAATAYLLTTAVIAFPWIFAIWRRARREWQLE